jgi:CDP-2,3-bis-(O-geranylgeranyl)-sn-glycerol synthase
MLITIIQALYFFLPAYIANAVPVFLARYRMLEFLNIPVDFNLKIGGIPVTGPNKTYRGIIGGIIGAMLMVTIQYGIHQAWAGHEMLYLFRYEFPSVLFLGFLMGLGEGAADVIKSIIKRRFHVKSGAPFIPYDQMSYLGALLLSFFYYIPSAGHIWSIILISPILPVLANIIAYRAGWKKVWW